MKKTNVLSNITYHYTNCETFYKIFETGNLQPTSKNSIDNERPVLWFSREKFWEQTANIKIIREGCIETLSFDQMMDNFEFLARFGVPEECLIPWSKLRIYADITSGEVRHIETQARFAASDTSKWSGFLSPIPISLCKIDILDSSMKWKRIQGNCHDVVYLGWGERRRRNLVTSGEYLGDAL